MMECDQAKLFVGGISWETNEEILKEHFSKYGTVAGSAVAKDRNTGSSRGFGFVWFSDSSSADKALQDTHVILRRTVEVKKAVPRGEQPQNQQQQQHQHQTDQQQNGGLSRNSSNGSSNNQFRTKKIFVGGLAATLTEEEFKNYFERFGRITDVVVMHDSSTNRPRGFGFITFDSEESVENVMQDNFHQLSGKLVEVKRAVPKEGNNNSNSGYNMRVGGGRGSPFNSYQYGNFAVYSPTRYGMYPVYPPLSGYGGVGGYFYGASTYGSGYPMGGYNGIGYWVPPIAPRSPWNGPGTIGSRGCLLPYGNATIYPTYLNGGVGAMGMASNVYDGFVGLGVNGKLIDVVGSDAHVPADATLPQIDVVRLDADSSGLKGSYGAASGKQNQRGLDERFKPYPVGSSS